MSKLKLDIRKGIPLTIHILFCIAILCIPLLLMSRYGIADYRYYTGYLIRTIFLIFLFYINYLYLIEKFLFKKQFVAYIIVNIILVVAIVMLQNFIFELLFQPPPHEDLKEKGGPRPPHELRLLGDYILIIFVIGMSVALRMTAKWYKDSINLETVKATQLEADLRNLRSQLNPHFLFNTLNNIYSLIAIDTNKAQESVHRLSSLLRYILYDNEHKFVTLDKEIEFTKNYIDLMRLRISSDIKLNVLIKGGDNSKQQIASLMFVTLIENAFKHGINTGKESFIDIKIYVDEGRGVLCTVENSLDNPRNDIENKNSGIGLTNLRTRLDLLYPDNSELRIEKRVNSFFVLLSIQFQ